VAVLVIAGLITWRVHKNRTAPGVER
jgi:hypothetical protein